jgi:hypothetical protein
MPELSICLDVWATTTEVLRVGARRPHLSMGVSRSYEAAAKAVVVGKMANDGAETATVPSAPATALPMIDMARSIRYCGDTALGSGVGSARNSHLAGRAAPCARSPQGEDERTGGIPRLVPHVVPPTPPTMRGAPSRSQCAIVRRPYMTRRGVYQLVKTRPGDSCFVPAAPKGSGVNDRLPSSTTRAPCEALGDA